MPKSQVILSWVCRIIAALILGQTLFFKFTGATESIFIFSSLGAEPWGRIGSGVIELVAILLLLYPRSAALGALVALGTMSGAILAHLFVLGIEVQNDGGLLFGLAITTWICAAIVIVLHRDTLPSLWQGLSKKQ